LKATFPVILADKLTAGKAFDIAAYFSRDNGVTWQVVNGTTWNSYGLAGYTVKDPDGTLHVNPDPTLYIPLNGAKGALVKLVITPRSNMTAGLLLETF
jgi:hypothetical protein